MAEKPPWWAGMNAEIYLNESRFHALCRELDVPLIGERVTETSIAAEGGAEGGVFGLFKGKSTVGRTRTVSTKEIVTEPMLIHEIYEKATSLQLPRIVRLMEPVDWDILVDHLLVHGEGDFSLVSEPVPELDSNVVHEIGGVIAGRTVSIRFSGNHVRSNSGTSELFSLGEERITFLGRPTSRQKRAGTTEIRPIMIGYPV